MYTHVEHSTAHPSAPSFLHKHVREIGGACVAAPVLLAGKPVAAVSVAGPAFRMDERKRRELGEMLVASLGAASVDLSAAMRAGG